MSLPERPPPPPFSSSLPEIEPLPRPRVVLLAGLLVLVAAVLQVWVTAAGLLDVHRIRTALVKQLGEQSPDFSSQDIRHAVDVVFFAAHAVAVLLFLVVVLNFNKMLSRKLSARTGFTIATVLFVPVAVFNLLLRQAGQQDLLATVGSGLALLLAVAIGFLPSVSAWLHQLERNYRISLDPTGSYPKDAATSD